MQPAFPHCNPRAYLCLSANMTTSPPPVVIEDQARLLEDALTVVRQQTVQMKRCLESPGKLMDALKCRSVAIGMTEGVLEEDADYNLVLLWSRNYEQAAWDLSSTMNYTWPFSMPFVTSRSTCAKATLPPTWRIYTSWYNMPATSYHVSTS